MFLNYYIFVFCASNNHENPEESSNNLDQNCSQTTSWTFHNSKKEFIEEASDQVDGLTSFRQKRRKQIDEQVKKIQEAYEKQQEQSQSQSKKEVDSNPKSFSPSDLKNKKDRKNKND
ncbi:hypothetical protein EHP00_1459 [Ecytonucleospora hepatopenaei]|uniref:Uncharacterized protein n=1 Tax=Ecytonucleospora hepatopenaei TaxID=646526 RepID=A0A1W0E4M5_9MICR|nr:hypothetical protein EHP00_1459 [Ecytonucleospora hepatopenaei]